MSKPTDVDVELTVMSFFVSHADKNGLITVMRWEIGKALDMSTDSVDQHLRSLRRQGRLKRVTQSKQKGEGNTYRVIENTCQNPVHWSNQCPDSCPAREPDVRSRREEGGWWVGKATTKDASGEWVIENGVWVEDTSEF